MIHAASSKNLSWNAGNWVLVGFGIMLLFMTYLVIRCIQNPSIMVSKTYYEEELVFQKQIDAQQQAANYASEFKLTEHQGLIHLAIPQSLAQGFEKGQLKVYHRSDDRADRLLELQFPAENRFTISSTDWKPGTYILKLDLTSSQQRYYHEFNFKK